MFRINRIDRTAPHRDAQRVVVFEVHEGQTWRGTDLPRPSITVEYRGTDRSIPGYERPAEISWPSTSDKRPELAVALAHALILANNEAALEADEEQNS